MMGLERVLVGTALMDVTGLELGVTTHQESFGLVSSSPSIRDCLVSWEIELVLIQVRRASLLLEGSSPVRAVVAVDHPQAKQSVVPAKWEFLEID
jgi:hypothetical protein